MSDKAPVNYVKHCARCGEDHDDLHFKRFVNPIEDDDNIIWEWWATCPITGDPILLCVISEDNQEMLDDHPID